MFHGIESKIIKWPRQASKWDARTPGEFKCLPDSGRSTYTKG